VQVSAPESRDALEKGVADAITFPWDSIISFGIDKVTAKFHTDFRLYAASFVWVMNKGWYDKLGCGPEEGDRRPLQQRMGGQGGRRLGRLGGQRRRQDGEDGRPHHHQAHAAAAGRLAPGGGADDAQWIASADKAGVNGRAVLDDLRKRAEGAQGRLLTAARLDETCLGHLRDRGRGLPAGDCAADLRQRALRDLGRQIPDWFDLSKQLQAIAMFWGIALATCAAATSAWTCCGSTAAQPGGAASTWRPRR
jgi:hypothetical protein